MDHATAVSSGTGRRLYAALRSSTRARVAAAFVVLALALLAGGAGPARAYEADYTCGVMAPGGWCQYTARHTYFYNEAKYPGTGTVWVCQKAINATTGAKVESSCNYNLAYQSYSYSGLQIVSIYNGGPNSHTINGVALF